MKESLGNWGALYFLKECSLVFLPSAAGFPTQSSFFKVKGLLSQRTWPAGNSPWYWVAHSRRSQCTSQLLTAPSTAFSTLCVQTNGQRRAVNLEQCKQDFSSKDDLNVIACTKCWRCCAWGQVVLVFIHLSEVNLSCYWSNDLGKTTW